MVEIEYFTGSVSISKDMPIKEFEDAVAHAVQLSEFHDQAYPASDHTYIRFGGRGSVSDPNCTDLIRLMRGLGDFRLEIKKVGCDPFWNWQYR